MDKNRSPIIQATELLALYKSKNLVLIDARNGKNAKENYEEKHLEGALFVDLNSQLADIKEDFSIGGRLRYSPSVLPLKKHFKTIRPL